VRLGRFALALTAGAALAALAGSVLAGDEASSPAAVTPPAPAAEGGLSSLDLSIRARALGPVEIRPPGLSDLATTRAPTGSGTLRMPSAVTEVRPGVYVGFTPVCIPGYDEPFVNPPRRPSRRR
jgi:hypothetical protein